MTLASPYVVFALALCTRLAIIAVDRTYLDVEHTEIVRVATSLAEHGRFADPFGPSSGPTAHVAPMYPILLSVIFKLFGTGSAGELAQEAFSSVIASLSYAALPFLSSAALGESIAGSIAGVVGAVLPVNFWSETKGSFEAPLAGLALIAFCTLVCRLWRIARFTPASGAIIGFTAGFALLTSPSLAPPIALVLLLGFFQFAGDRSKYFGFALTAVLCAALSVLPWALRNSRVLGGPVWSRSGLGLELFISNNDAAAANWLDNIDSGWFQRSHPFFSSEERSKRLTMGELPYNRGKMDAAVHWIRAHPTHFLRLSAQHLYYFWFPRMNRTTQRLLMAVYAVGGCLGVISLFRAKDRCAWVFLAVLASYPLIYYFVESFARYRCPLDPILILLTVIATNALFNRTHGVRAAGN